MRVAEDLVVFAEGELQNCVVC